MSKEKESFFEKISKDNERHLKIREEFCKLERKESNYEDLDYIMFLIWVRCVGGENKMFSSRQDEVYKDESENISYPKLKEIVSIAYNLGYNNGTKDQEKESEAVLEEKLNEREAEVEKSNDNYWKNRIKGYCNHSWKRIPNPISDYDDYVCEICGERK